MTLAKSEPNQIDNINQQFPKLKTTQQHGHLTHLRKHGAYKGVNSIHATAPSQSFVHGSPSSNHEYLLPEMDAFTALERVLSSEADVLFCGHTHIPYVRTLDSGQLQVKMTI